MALTLDEAVEQLGHRLSPKRRSAATRLRRLADPVAGPPLLDALEREVRDPRTWETQYQMVMALGMCGHRPRLSAPEATADSLRWCLDSGTPMLADGALRAVAMQRLRPDTTTIDHVLDLLGPLGPHDGLRFWAAAAAAGWPGPRVQEFLRDCAAGPRTDVASAAASSLRGKYQTCTPL
ncbi:hypothetical protein [Kitasatospora aureofaciens]|uniref:hypothetical protein n=1 Tax=Kitasatospora aureofaciens TaxID=1894 RepID=UPI0004C99ED9|nr:hypothetical protein [Kitasatospora aureofaciens]